MNVATLEMPPEEKLQPKVGAILQHPVNGLLFILAQTDSSENGPRFCAISLTDGNRWAAPSVSVDTAAQGFQVLCHAAGIIIRPVK